MIGYAIAMIVIESILRPILIAKSGGKLPFLALFIGVTGGMLAWGFTGMFKGAIIMALFYTVFAQWLQRKKIDEDPSEVVWWPCGPKINQLTTLEWGPFFKKICDFLCGIPGSFSYAIDGSRGKTGPRAVAHQPQLRFLDGTGAGGGNAVVFYHL